MKKLFYLLSMVLLTLTISCNDDDNLVNPITLNPIDVYVAGSKNNQACYWKNNQLVTLSNNNSFTRADSIIVKNNVVHVLGSGIISGVYKKFYWKNGVLTNLNQTFSTPNQVVQQITGWDIDGNDVYFVGYTKNPFIDAEIYDLVYWKNGTKTIVKQNTNNLVDSKIKILNNSVYISGKENDIDGYYINNIFNEMSNMIIKDFAVNNTEINIYGDELNVILPFPPPMPNGFYKNITTGVFSILPSSAYILLFDNNNIYYSNGFEIYKNNVVIYDVQAQIPGNFILDFKVLNNNVYTLENQGDFVLNQIVTVNSTTIMTALTNEFFNSFFIYQN